MPQDDKGRYKPTFETRTDASLPSAPRTGATGQGPEFDTSDIITLGATFDVTAHTGTSFMYLALQTSIDGVAWADALSTNQAGFGTDQATATQYALFTGIGALSRWAWSQDTPADSFTWSVTVSVNRDD